MELKQYFTNVTKGVIGALSVTLILTALMSLMMVFFDFSETVISIGHVITTSIGVIFGTIIASKLHGHKGWLVGLAVGVFFYIALYLLGIIFGAEAIFNLHVLLKFGLCTLAGLLSGMLGINLSKN